MRIMKSNNKTPISNMNNCSYNSIGESDISMFIYQLALKLDNVIEIASLTNTQRLEIAINEFLEMKKDKAM